MATELGQYEVVIDAGGGGEVFVRQEGLGWIVDHMSFYGDHGSIIGGVHDTWYAATQAALAYAIDCRKPRP